MEKRGLYKLGYIENLEELISELSALIGRDVEKTDIDEFIESSDYKEEYIDEFGKPTLNKKEEALTFRFELPWKSTNNEVIYGYFWRKGYNDNFIGCYWFVHHTFINIYYHGYVGSKCFESISDLSKLEVSEKNIFRYITKTTYVNSKGVHKNISKGDAAFIRLDTNLKDSFGNIIIGWFSKQKKFKDITWGNKESFTKNFGFTFGKFKFNTAKDSKEFLERVNSSAIQENWNYKNNKSAINFPILKSYLEHEFDRLCYEYYSLSSKHSLIFNSDESCIIFNTNLINKFGQDLIISGRIERTGNESEDFFISDLALSPSKNELKKQGFDTSKEPQPPHFFESLDEILFHSEWEIDMSFESYEHILLYRDFRLPEEYRSINKESMGRKLTDSINFAKNIAKKNYKFIVPMYYPAFRRVQFLMPIYLESTFSNTPDFALVLTPVPEYKMYKLETILTLDEAYQDARLIAKPEEVWLRPRI